MYKSLTAIFSILICVCVMQAQSDPTLFSVENVDVPVSEFQYIYEKTNTGQVTYTKESLEEYLDLYTKFKLKVQRARDLQMDTISSLQRELDNYRRQLANTYLIDKEVTERLTQEVYERTKYDVNISHILARLDKDATAADSSAALTKINQAKMQLDGDNVSFGSLAKRYSEDPSSAKQDGKIGYTTAMLPNGFYALETAAYEMKVGEVKGPILTSLGYHLVKLNDKRPARGNIEVAHILFRADQKNSAIVKAKADSVFLSLNEGNLKWDEAVVNHSQDELSARKSGYVGFVRINIYEPLFEEACFNLKKDGDLSTPVKSSAGWHIIKRISQEGLKPYEEVQRKLQSRISRDGRYEIAKKALIQQIRDTAGVVSERFVLDHYLNGLDKNFLTFKWRPDKTNNEDMLYKVGNLEFNLGDFKKYCMKQSAVRTRRGIKGDLKKTYYGLYSEFQDDCVLQYEEKQLSKKYPDFRNLMNEYEEGILLFEVTKREVWDMASSDTLGLQNFFDRNRERYVWPERAEIIDYTIKTTDSKIQKKIMKSIAKKSPSEVTVEYNKEGKILVSYTRDKAVKNKSPKLLGMKWESGTIKKMPMQAKDKDLRVIKIEKVLPASNKSLNESRGFVMADYQEELEFMWVEGLRKKYAVDVNQSVLNGLIK